MTDEFVPDELLCPCGHPASTHYDGCYEVVNHPRKGDLCECMISLSSLQELEEPLRKLAAYENPQNYAHMRQLANAAADALACWMDEERQDELDRYMGALKRALENYKG